MNEQRESEPLIDRILGIVIGLPIACASFLLDKLAGLLERAEFGFSFLVGCVHEVGSMLGQILGPALLAPINWIAFPFFVCARVAQDCSEFLSDRSEWIVGQGVFVATELVTMLAKILFWIPCQMADVVFALVWRGPVGWLLRFLVRLVVPKSVRDRVPRFSSVSQAVIAGLSVSLEFVGNWFSTRYFERLWFALPAMTLTMMVAVLALLSLADTSDDKIQRYRASLSRALLEQSETESELALAKLSALGYQRQDAERFRVAIAKEESSGSEAAFPLMESLVESEDGGFGPAKIWVAYRLVAGKTNLDSEEAFSRASLLVNDYIARDGHNADTRILLSEIRNRLEGVGAAIEQLSPISDSDRFDVQARLMELHRASGNLAAARSYAEEAIDRFAEQDARGYRFNTEQRLQCAEAYAVCKRWSEAKDFMHELSDDDLKAESRAAARVVQLIFPYAPNAVAYTISMYRLHPSHRLLNQRLEREFHAGSDLVTEFVAKQRSIGRVDASLYRMAGDYHFVANDRKAAAEHYAIALETNPKDAVAANNIAWLHLEEERFQEALVAANKTVSIEPKPNYLETRGQVFAKLSRYDEAIADLVRALNGQLPNPANTHRTLASIYEKVGKRQLSHHHAIRSKVSADGYGRTL